jgi:hypothetical protein
MFLHKGFDFCEIFIQIARNDKICAADSGRGRRTGEHIFAGKRISRMCCRP